MHDLWTYDEEEKVYIVDWILWALWSLFCCCRSFELDHWIHSSLLHICALRQRLDFWLFLHAIVNFIVRNPLFLRIFCAGKPIEPLHFFPLIEKHKIAPSPWPQIELHPFNTYYIYINLWTIPLPVIQNMYLCDSLRPRHRSMRISHPSKQQNFIFLP